MRLIDADEAIINFGFEWDDICPTRDEVVSFLRKQKTIDAVAVVHGEWERMINPYGELEGFMCKCGHQSQSASNFCPNCGARMDGGEKE